MGAITIFLFVLGMILCKGRDKWWLFAAMVFAILLAWGNHFMAFTELCFNYLPMYNKFRTVSMILIVLQVLMPMLGFLILDRIIKDTYERRQVIKAAAIAFAITAGFCLVSIMAPAIAGSYITDFDATLVSQMFGVSNQELMGYGIKVNTYTDAVADYRASLMMADAMRSFMLILVAAALILLPYFAKSFESRKWKTILAGGLVLVVLFDLWGVGKRYLNKDNFVEKSAFEAIYAAGEDPYGLEDPDLHFRVLDIPNFGNAITSYYYNTIGGYSAVKMQRYQDLIDYYLSAECQSVSKNGLESSDQVSISSMLNAKYIFTQNEILFNPFVLGNCWFVKSYAAAATPDEEIELIGTEALWNTAVIGEDFAWAREHFDNVQPDSYYSDYDYIGLTHYAPNELRYEFTTFSERAAIFSEVYYPKGWKAWIEPAGAYGEVVDGRYQPTAEGREIELFRADWILRGAIIPEGEGQIIMRFEPESYRTGENISRISSILLILLLLGSTAGIIFLRRKSN